MGLRPRTAARQSPLQSSPTIPNGLVRYQNSGGFHLITFSCYRGEALLARVGAHGVFWRVLETVRRRDGMVAAGYVPMPEHYASGQFRGLARLPGLALAA
jgi:hypothetical protein